MADETTPAEKAQYDKARRELLSGPVLILDCVVLENPPRIPSALAWHADGMDFADALHLAGSEQEQCVDLKTFDIAFIKKAADRAVKVSLRHEDVGRGAPCFI